MAHLIVETAFDPPLTDEELNRQAKRLTPCLAAYGAAWQRSYLSADRKKMICIFEAPDADAVRTSYRNAEVKFERVWSAELMTKE